MRNALFNLYSHLYYPLVVVLAVVALYNILF